MGIVQQTIILLVTLGVLLLGFVIYDFINDNVTPPILENTWWGPGIQKKDNSSIVPFKIVVSDEEVLDLKLRLEKAKPFTPALEGVAQHYGMNSYLLEEIVDFWKTKYDWKQREKFLNKFPQFKTQIQGLNIHYIHVKPTKTKKLTVVPLLLLHGWPGSVREFYEIIPMLTTPRDEQDFVFEVIIPSLPGYGFSDGAAKPGLGAAQMAVVLNNLMQRLGFEKYYLHGGDWGSIIVTNMGILFKNHVLGMHINGCLSNTMFSQMVYLLGSLYPPMIVEKQFEDKMYPLTTFFYNLMVEFGYLHLQATKPDTIGVALTDSPVGLASYILEKFSTWTNPNGTMLDDGGLKNKFKYENLIDNIMIYWISNSITTSMRLYSETLNIAHNNLKLDSYWVKVPTACAKMENDLFYQPDIILKDKYPKLLQSNYFKNVGHFATFEEPKIIADDIWSAMEKFEKIRKSA